MPITKYGLEAIGFKRIPDDVEIRANFKSIRVYQIQGLKLDASEFDSPGNFKAEMPQMAFCIGKSVNAICQELLDDDYADDEDEWAKSKDVSPPYLMTVSCLQETQTCSEGLWLEKDNWIVTHCCFREAIQKLHSLDANSSAVLIPALSAAFSTRERAVLFVEADKSSFADTNLGKQLKDIEFRVGPARVQISTPAIPDEIEGSFNRAIELSGNLHNKIGHFFNLAISEKDLLRKFLFIFFCLEIHINKEFKRIETESALTQHINLPPRLEGINLSNLVRIDLVNNLAHRFEWCAVLKWEGMNFEDILLFREIKKARDKFSHGEIVPEESLPTDKGLGLLLKILDQ